MSAHASAERPKLVAPLLALIGLRCAGKSTVGARVAQLLSLPFIDLDQELPRVFAALLARDAHDDDRARRMPCDERQRQARAGGLARQTPGEGLTRHDARSVATLHAGEILARFGETPFRDAEQHALELVFARAHSCVLATGGGVVEREPNRRLLARAASCVWLDANDAELERRARAQASTRPPLTALDARAEIASLRARRAPHYRELASLVIATDRLDVEAAAAAIVDHLRARPAMGTS